MLKDLSRRLDRVRIGLIRCTNMALYGQPVKPSPRFIRGERSIREGSVVDYPIPCTFCNTILQDGGFSFESLLRQGLIFFQDDKLIQQYHVWECPVKDTRP